MPHSVIQQVHLLALQDKMPLLRQQSLIFERRPGVPLDPATLQDEADDFLVFGDDDDYVPAASFPDMSLIHDNIVSLNEIHALYSDAASISLSSSSEEEHSFASLASDIDRRQW